MTRQVVVTGPFDQIDHKLFRFMHEASRIGPVEARLYSDRLIKSLRGQAPKFEQAEREYVLDALRYVNTVTVVDELPRDGGTPGGAVEGGVWAVDESEASDAKEAFCADNGMTYRVITAGELQDFPAIDDAPTTPGGKNIIVTGCYDWFHSGHVRFFEEVSEHGNLHVVVGHDDNVRALKGEGHPMFPEDMRRYMAQSIRFVTQAYVSTGHGWMDAEPEIERLKPDVYAVNSDGDRPEKQKFCSEHGLEYLVLERKPKPGLARRTSTDLRGF